MPADPDCFYCEGTGTVKCESCHGRGGANRHRYGPAGFDPMSSRPLVGRMVRETCTTCRGRGKVKCPECRWDEDDDLDDLDDPEALDDVDLHDLDDE